MWVGVLYGLSACALWGIVYLMPLLLPSYDSVYLAIARAFIMGAVSIGILVTMRSQFKVLTRQDWVFATLLTLVGNLIQCWFLMMSVEISFAMNLYHGWIYCQQCNRARSLSQSGQHILFNIFLWTGLWFNLNGNVDLVSNSQCGLVISSS